MFGGWKLKPWRRKTDGRQDARLLRVDEWKRRVVGDARGTERRAARRTVCDNRTHARRNSPAGTDRQTPAMWCPSFGCLGSSSRTPTGTYRTTSIPTSDMLRIPWIRPQPPCTAESLWIQPHPPLREGLPERSGYHHRCRRDLHSGLQHREVQELGSRCARGTQALPRVGNLPRL